jgi:hypothetical protein
VAALHHCDLRHIARPSANLSGQAEDVADQILMMLRNTFMTGSVVYIDGGGLLV